MGDLYDVHFLNPVLVDLVHDSGGSLRGSIEGREYSKVVLTRAFPLSKPNQYISISEPGGKEIGVLPDLEQLDAASLRAAKVELKFRYFVPVVTRIDRIKQAASLWSWDIQTDRGPLRILMRNLHDHVQTIGQGRLLLTDMDGKRCEIERIDKLDPHSRRELNKIS